jgi:endonuclease/exonuclease/phosphatase (EEP) superfamily protein YafD
MAFLTLTVLALPAALVSLAAWFSSTPHFLAQLSPFRVQAGLLLLAHAGFCLALRRRRWAATFAMLAGLQGALVAHATLGGNRPAPPASGSETGPDRPLKVLFSNVLTSNPDSAPLLGLIAEERPDLVALIEVNARWTRELNAALAEEYPHRFVRAREDNFGVAIYSRAEPLGARVVFFADVETPSIDFVLLHPRGDIRILVTHPLPPGDPAGARLRDEHIGDLANWHRHVAGLTPAGANPISILVLGDLNATPWCPPLRRLLANTGLRTAARDHRRLAPTWPVPIPWLRIPLDHALLNGSLACTDYRVGPSIGSDHAPLILSVIPVPHPDASDAAPAPALAASLGDATSSPAR